MQRKFLKNLAFLILVNILVKPFWILGVDRSVQNSVGAGEYGTYFAIFNFSFLFHILLDFGISNFNNRAVSRNRGLLDKFLPNIFMVKICLGLLYFVITFGSALLVDFSSFQLYLLGFLAINQFLVSFILYFRSNIAGLQLFRLDALLSVLDRVLMIGIVGVLLWLPFIKGFQIEWFVYAQTGSYLLTFFISFALVLGKSMHLSLRLNWPTFKRIIRLSYPFAILGLMMAIYSRIDAVMIERMLGEAGKEEAGIYAASFRLLDAVNMIGFAFASILLPLFARMIKKMEPIGNLLHVSYRTLMMVAVLVIVLSVFYRREIMDWLYVDATPYWSEIFGLLIISFAGIGTVYIFGSLLAAKGALKILNWIAITGVVLNIILNIWLIEEYKALGATIATVATEFLVAGAHILATWRVFRFRVNRGLVIRMVAFLVAVILVTGIVSMAEVAWIIEATTALLISVGIAFALGMVNIKEWKKEFGAGQ